MIVFDKDGASIRIPAEPETWKPGPALDSAQILADLEARVTPVAAIVIAQEIDLPLRTVERELEALLKGGRAFRTGQGRWVLA